MRARIKCLALDHDDTVVMSSPDIHYPSFVEAMRLLRPERAGMGFDEFIAYSCAPGIQALLTDVLCLNAEEMRVQQSIWRRYTRTRTPDAYPGFTALFASFRARGGHVAVISHSEREVILRHYRELFGFPIEDYYRCAGFDFARHPYPELAARFMEHYNAGVPGCAVTAHAVDTLQTLARMGWQQAVLSASRRDYLIEQVSARGLQGFFTELLGLADIYGVSKVQLGTDYLHRTGIDPAACVMVGDTDHDAEVAAAIGATCVLYTGGHQSRARLEKASPYVIDDLAQLPALLETI